MLTKEFIRSRPLLGPIFAVTLLALTVTGWYQNWFGFGPFWEDPLTAWAAFIASVVIIGCVIYLIAFLSGDATSGPGEDVEVDGEEPPPTEEQDK